MAQRTSIAAVRNLLTTDQSAALDDPQVQAAIDAATIQVDRIAAADCHTATSLELVERYLAASIAVQTTLGGEVTEEKIGDASEKRNKTSDGENSYYKTAVSLDCSGQLADFGKPAAFINMFGGAYDYS